MLLVQEANSLFDKMNGIYYPNADQTIWTNNDRYKILYNTAGNPSIYSPYNRALYICDANNNWLPTKNALLPSPTVTTLKQSKNKRSRDEFENDDKENKGMAMDIDFDDMAMPAFKKLRLSE